MDHAAGEQFVRDVGQLAIEVRQLRSSIDGLRADLQDLEAKVRQLLKGASGATLLASLFGRR